MRFIVVLFIILTSIGTWAKMPSALNRDSILDLLPKELATLSTETTSGELETAFNAKIIQKSKNVLHLKYFRRKNDVTIGVKDGTFSYLYVEASDEIQKNSRDLFQKAVSALSEEERRTNSLKQKSGSHDSGRYITVELPGLGVKLSFVDNERKDLHSIIIWPVGEKLP